MKCFRKIRFCCKLGFYKEKAMSQKQKGDFQSQNLQYDKVFSYFKENKGLVIILCITDFLFNGLMCLVPVVQGLAINAFSDGKPFSEVLNIILLFLGLIVVVQINRYVKRFLGRSFGNRIALRMRRVCYDNLLHTKMSYFQTASKGDILNKNLTDIDEASDGITKMTTEIFDTIVLLLGYLITMLWMDYKITLIIMIFIVISILSNKVLKNLIYGYTKEYKECLSKSKDITLSCLENELNYRGFGINGIYRQRFEAVQDELEKKARKSMILQNCLEPIYSIITWFGFFFIVWIGGNRVLDHTLSIGVFSAFLSTYMLMATKASRLGRVYGWYQNLRVSWERCKPFLGTHKEENRAQKAGEKLEDFKIKLKEFSFGFDEAFKLPIMNLEASAGEIIGVCGMVHTGKSTFLSGLTGLYEHKGHIWVNEEKLEDSNIAIGYCPATSQIFEDTLEYNVTMGRTGDFYDALKDAAFSEEVDAMDKKEKQFLYHSQVNLSGGQQKRLMLARALFGRPELILLDDPFQSIDKDNVLDIIKHLKNYKNSVIFAVTNQRQLLEKMDKVILFMEDSYVLGTFPEILPYYEEVGLLAGQFLKSEKKMDTSKMEGRE